VLQVNVRRSQELIKRGAALHERRPQVHDTPYAGGRSDTRSLPLEQQQGIVQAGQGGAQGERMASRLAARTSELQAPCSVKSVQELLRLWRRAGAKMPSVDSLSVTGVLDGGHLQRRITFPRARSSSMRFGGGSGWAA